MTRDEAVHVIETLKWLTDLLVEVEKAGVKFDVDGDILHDVAITTAILEKYANEEDGERITWN